jgi:hypothetical protein
MKYLHRLMLAATLITVAWAGAVHAQSYDTNLGANSFAHLSYGSYNTAVGYNAMYYDTSGYYNTVMGYDALMNNSTDSGNTAIGMYAATNTITGWNTALGFEALYGNQTGIYNIAIGYYAGGVPASGSNNIHIGNQGLTKDNATIRIGTQGTQKFTQIAGIYDSKVVGGRAVVVDAKGHLGYAVVKVVPNVAAAPATTADVLSLRTEIAGLRTQLNAMQAKLASKGIR